VPNISLHGHAATCLSCGANFNVYSVTYLLLSLMEKKNVENRPYLTKLQSSVQWQPVTHCRHNGFLRRAIECHFLVAASCCVPAA